MLLVLLCTASNTDLLSLIMSTRYNLSLNTCRAIHVDTDERREEC